MSVVVWVKLLKEFIMNIDNIKKLIKTLEAVEYVEDVRRAESGFNMLDYTHDCGTPSCIAGYAAFLSNPNDFENSECYNKAVSWLGLDHNGGALRLFCPLTVTDWDDIKPEHVIKALNIIIEENDIPENIWERVMK